MSFSISNHRQMQHSALVDASPSFLIRARGLAGVANRALVKSWTWLLSTIATPNKTKTVSIIDKVALTDKSMLAVASVEGRRFLIGTAPSGISLLAELDSNDRTQLRSKKIGTSTVPRRKKTTVVEERTR
jgi:hypothetical protein